MSGWGNLKVGKGTVARGSVGDALIFVPKGDTTVPDEAATLPDIAAVHEIHTLTVEEIRGLLARFAWEHPAGERVLLVRRPEMEKDLGGGVSIHMAAESEYRQNRAVVLASGPDATTRLRTRLPIREDGTTKVVVEVLPGDLVEVGQYAFGEVPTEQMLGGKRYEILVANARDITRVLWSSDLARKYEEAGIDGYPDAHGIAGAVAGSDHAAGGKRAARGAAKRVGPQDLRGAPRGGRRRRAG